MALKRKSRSRMKTISIRKTRSTGNAIKSAMPAVVMSWAIIAAEASDQPVIGMPNPSASSTPVRAPSVVATSSTIATRTLVRPLLRNGAALPQRATRGTRRA
jgi:hypothetical protein